MYILPGFCRDEEDRPDTRLVCGAWDLVAVAAAEVDFAEVG